MENKLTEELTHKKINAPFINRIIALILDFITLGIFGLILGIFLKSTFSLAGIHGVLIGWFISSIYFAFGNSKFLSGQTFGKWMSSLRVTDTNGQFLHMGTAVYRSLLFTTPYFLFDYLQQFFYTTSIINTLLVVITTSYYIGLAYFFIVNTQSRQTIHDFIAKTLVTKNNQNPSEIPLVVSRSKVYVFLGIVLIVIVSLYSISFWFKESTNISQVLEANQKMLSEIASEVVENENVLYVESSSINIDIDSKVGIEVVVWTNKNLNEIDTENIASDILLIIGEKTFKLSRIDYAEVILYYGFDIGIAKTKESKSWKFDN